MSTPRPRSKSERADYHRTNSAGCRMFGIWTKAPYGGFVEWFSESSYEAMGLWFVSPLHGGTGWMVIEGLANQHGPYPTIADASAAIANIGAPS